MNSSTIEHFLSSRCRGQFMGVFSSDTLPTNIKKRPAIIVANTDPSDRGGEHWICIYVDKIDAENSLTVSVDVRVNRFALTWINIV